MSSFGSLGSMWVEIGAKISGLEKGLADASKAIDKTLREAEQRFEGFGRLGDKLTGIGTSLTAALTLPLAGLGVASVKAAGDFESAMNRVSALGNIVGDNLKRLEDQAQALGKATKFSSREAAEGMAELAAKGFDTQQIFQAMPTVMNLAAAGQTSVGESAKIAAGIMGQFGIAAQDIGRAADVIAKAALKGGLSLNDMSLAMKYAGPNAKAAGIEFNELATAMALVAKAGIQGEMAGTGFRSIIAALVQPTTDAQKALDRLKTTVSDVPGKLRSLDDIFLQLRQGGANAADMFTIFGREASSVANILLEKAGPAFGALRKEVDESTGTLNKAAAIMQKGIKGALEQLGGSIETAFIAMGQALEPFVLKLAAAVQSLVDNAITPMIEGFKDLPSSMQIAIGAFAALLATIGPMTLAIGSLVKLIPTLVLGFQTLTGGVSALQGLLGAGGLLGSLTALTPIAIAFGAALAGWALYTAYTELRRVNNELDQTFQFMQRGERATRAQADEIRMLEAALKQYNAQLSTTQKLSVDSHGKTVEQYVKALRDAVGSIDQFKDKQADFNAEIKSGSINLVNATARVYGYSDATKKTTKDIQILGDTGLKAGEAIRKSAETISNAFRGLKIVDSQHEQKRSIQELLDAFGDLERAYKSGKISADDFARAQGVVSDALDKLTDKSKKAGNEIRDLSRYWTTELNRMASQMVATMSVPIEATLKLGDSLADAFRRLPLEVAAAKKNIEDIASAMRLEFLAAEDAARKVPDRIKDLGKQLGINKVEVKDWADTFSKEVSTIVTNATQSMAKALFEGNLNLLDKVKTMFREIGQAAVAAFLQPFVDGLSKGIAAAMSGIIGGIFGGRGMGDLGGAIGSAISGSVAKAFGRSGGQAVGTAVSAGSAAVDLGGYFSGITGAANTAGKTAATAGEAAGEAGSGMQSAMDWFGAIIKTIDTIAGIVQRMRQESSLNAIEHNTRYGMIHLEQILLKANEFWPSISQIHAAIYEYFGYFASLMTTVEEIRDAVVSGLVRAIETVGDGIEKIVTNTDPQNPPPSNDPIENLEPTMERMIASFEDFDTTVSNGIDDVIYAIDNTASAVEESTNSIVDAVVETSTQGARAIASITDAVWDGMSKVANNVLELPGRIASEMSSQLLPLAPSMQLTNPVSYPSRGPASMWEGPWTRNQAGQIVVNIGSIRGRDDIDILVQRLGDLGVRV